MSDFPFPEPPEGMTPEKWAQLHNLAAEAGAEHVRKSAAALEEAFDGELVLDAGSVYLAWMGVNLAFQGEDIAALAASDPERRERILHGVALARGGTVATTDEPDMPGDDAGTYRRALVEVARMLPPAEEGEDTPIGRAHDCIHRALYPERHVREDG